MEKRELTCINCPLGCPLTVTIEDGVVTAVTGHTCPRGEKYGHEEVTAPVRTVTSTVVLQGGRTAVLPCKTAAPVPKATVPAVLRELKAVTLAAPVRRGDVVLPNTVGTGVDVIATADSGN